MGSSDTVTDLASCRLLPRLEPAVARALSRLYGALPAVRLVVGGATYELEWDFAALPVPGQEAFRFRLGPHAGWLYLDAPAQCALMHERRAESLPKDLRYLLLADALAPLADRLEALLRLRFEWSPDETAPAAEPAEAERGACFLVQADDGTRYGGWIRFDPPQALDKLLALVPARPRPRRHGLAGLRIPLSFVVGRTQIRLREVRSIRAGDIIGIEDWASSGSALVVTAQMGGPAGLQVVALAEGARITVQQLKDTAMTAEISPSTAPDEESDAGHLPLDRLDALEVTLRFEVGDLATSLGELRSLRPGHVFELGHELNRSPVRILAHGNVLGRGYLVAVGDRLGVRVSEFAPSEI
ncbi:MAG TPA: type III secretion system cytoplasmic ring protein SctQ [Burkholderiaceae bacterium]|nr:type III secretion system cytoplasmic ring protein SctQ [Burkholderiaceae bacterium]